MTRRTLPPPARHSAGVATRPDGPVPHRRATARVLVGVAGLMLLVVGVLVAASVHHGRGNSAAPVASPTTGTSSESPPVTVPQRPSPLADRAAARSATSLAATAGLTKIAPDRPVAQFARDQANGLLEDEEVGVYTFADEASRQAWLAAVRHGGGSGAVVLGARWAIVADADLAVDVQKRVGGSLIVLGVGG